MRTRALEAIIRRDFTSFGGTFLADDDHFLCGVFLTIFVLLVYLVATGWGFVTTADGTLRGLQINHVGLLVFPTHDVPFRLPVGIWEETGRVWRNNARKENSVTNV